MRRTCVVAAVLAALAGCDSKTPPVPTSPSPVPMPEPTPQVAEVTGTLVGFIRGVDPVTNDVDCYSAHHQFTLVRR